MSQPELFGAAELDATALAILAGRSRPRADLQAAGFYLVIKSSDLFDLGYSIAHWIKPGVPGSEVIEYSPCKPDDPRHRPGAVRVTIECYEDQAAFHRAVGARVVGRGRRFSR